ncbi:uncharacterized protein LOC134696584 isoform X1 [Mytilus trossulus]|uniref:uncharacterized protein LOC134696584 isoform X1 n=1 Tax=Mytilus trossulus TaxID=6551 RepID=UPI00300621BD
MTDNEDCCCMCTLIKTIFCCFCCRPFCWLTRQTRVGPKSGYDQLESKDRKKKYPASKAECIKEIDRLDREVENLNWRLQDKDNDIKDLKQEKDGALSRLSEMMGSKLRDNNPAIADLNDQNRPMKLAEQFTELYENEWTDAFTDLQELTKDGSDEKLTDVESIQILLHMLKEINEECVKDSSLQLSGLKEAFQCLPDEDYKEHFKKFKDLTKSEASKYLPLLCKKILDGELNCKTVKKYKTVCQQFIEVCVKICYLSAVQDPPMFLDFEPNDTFDKSTFKEFTVSGSRKDYLVWPALLIQKDGAILSKGVVQPIKESEDK